MRSKKQIALLFGMLVMGHDVGAVKKAPPPKVTYDGYEAMTWAQVPDDTKKMFEKNKLDVAGWIGWGCYHVKTRPDDRRYHSACVGERFIESPDFNKFRVTEPYIYDFR